MIVLDASVVIAPLDSSGALHESAARPLQAHADDAFAMHVVTRAEVPVGPARTGRLALAEARLAALDRLALDLPAAHAPALATLGVESGVRLPDCCVLLAAEGAGAAVATFDERLARAAGPRGLPVLA